MKAYELEILLEETKLIEYNKEIQDNFNNLEKLIGTCSSSLKIRKNTLLLKDNSISYIYFIRIDNIRIDTSNKYHKLKYTLTRLYLKFEENSDNIQLDIQNYNETDGYQTEKYKLNPEIFDNIVYKYKNLIKNITEECFNDIDSHVEYTNGTSKMVNDIDLYFSPFYSKIELNENLLTYLHYKHFPLLNKKSIYITPDTIPMLNVLVNELYKTQFDYSHNRNQSKIDEIENLIIEIYFKQRKI